MTGDMATSFLEEISPFCFNKMICFYLFFSERKREKEGRRDRERDKSKLERLALLIWLLSGLFEKRDFSKTSLTATTIGFL